MDVPEPTNPTATHLVPFPATPCPRLKTDGSTPVQVSPSLEYASVFVPEPTATHLVPFHVTLFP